MSVAYLVDGIRTPIGRYAGALSAVRPDDLAAHVLRVLRSRHPSVDWSAVDDVILGCVNQAGEDNRNLPGWPCSSPGCPTQSPARRSTVYAVQAPTPSRPWRARSGPRGRPGDRGRRGEHEPLAVRHPEGRLAVRARRRDLRLDDGLAVRQPRDPRRVRHARDRGTPRSPRASAASHAPTRTHSRCARSSERPRPADEYSRGDHAGFGAAAQGRAGAGVAGEHPPRNRLGQTRQAPTRVPRRRYRHRGKLVRRQRRRGALFLASERAVQRFGLSPSPWSPARRPPASHRGSWAWDRSRPRGSCSTGQAFGRRRRRHRTERGVRRAGAGGGPRLRASRRRGTG